MIDNLLDDIRDINLSYLLLVQRLLSEDRVTAMFRLKISESMADLLESLSVKQLSQLARTNQMLCRLCFDDVSQLQRLVNNPKEQGLGQTHAALLMASDQVVPMAAAVNSGNRI
ncbi:flagellar transcriptional regulator FlhD [Halomonas shantousis]